MNEEEDGDVLLMEPMHSGRTTHVISSGASPSRAASIVKSIRSPSARLATGFLLLGTTNNALYVVILTAALELIPRGTPTGVVAFANIAPALIAKAVWPYVLKGQVRYTRRVWSCVALSLMGILVSLLHIIAIEAFLLIVDL
jgi:battenin